MPDSYLPARIATGAYILHSGLEKWKGDEATAQGIHGMATGAYPFLGKIGPKQFLRLLAGAEMATGAALVVPILPLGLAGAALTGFSGALLGLYARTPGLRQAGSVWPTEQGVGISKDVWMLGIGLSMLAESRVTRRSRL